MLKRKKVGCVGEKVESLFKVNSVVIVDSGQGQPTPDKITGVMGEHGTRGRISHFYKPSTLSKTG
jgi:hypothetical protein